MPDTPAPVETDADKLVKAVEAAGFAPAVVAAPTAPTAKARIAEIAAELTNASPSGVETLAVELAALAETL